MDSDILSLLGHTSPFVFHTRPARHICSLVNIYRSASPRMSRFLPNLCKSPFSGPAYSKVDVRTPGPTYIYMVGANTDQPWKFLSQRNISTLRSLLGEIPGAAFLFRRMVFRRYTFYSFSLAVKRIPGVHLKISTATPRGALPLLSPFFLFSTTYLGIETCGTLGIHRYTHLDSDTHAPVDA